MTPLESQCEGVGDDGDSGHQKVHVCGDKAFVYLTICFLLLFLVEENLFVFFLLHLFFFFPIFLLHISTIEMSTASYILATS